MVYGLYALIGAVIGGGLVWVVYSIKANKIIEDLRQRLVVSEEKNSRIPKLEMTIAQNKTKIAELEADIVLLKDDVAAKVAEIAQLNQQLVDQRNAAKDKLSMVNDTQSRLSQAMTELSQTAMHCNNEEFVEAMKTNIAQFQEDVLKDIARWQGIEEPEVAESDEEIGIGVETPAMGEDQSLEEMIAAELSGQEEPVAEPETEAETDIGTVAEVEIAASEDGEVVTEGDEAAEMPVSEVIEAEAVAEAAPEGESPVEVEAETEEQVEVKIEPEAEAVAVETGENGDIEVKNEDLAVADAEGEVEVPSDAETDSESEQPVVVEEAVEASEEVEAAENGAEGPSNDDIQLAATADELSSLEKSLDEEISLELDEAFREDEEGIELKDEGEKAPSDLDFGGEGAEERPAFKFETNDTGVEKADNEAENGLLGDEDGDFKKKLNSESESIQIRKEAG